MKTLTIKILTLSFLLIPSLVFGQAKGSKLEVHFDVNDRPADGSMPPLSATKYAIGKGYCVAEITESVYGDALAVLDEQAGDPNYYSTRLFNAVATGIAQRSGTYKNSAEAALINSGIYTCAQSAASDACHEKRMEIVSSHRTSSMRIAPGFKIDGVLDTTGMLFKGPAYLVTSEVRCENNAN